jgi:hypothetical protein
LVNELSKTVIGTAVNLVVPGVGSLAVAGVGAVRGPQLKRAIAKALDDALKEVAVAPDVRLWDLRARSQARKRRQRVQKALKGGLTFEELMDSAGRHFQEPSPDGSQGLDRAPQPKQSTAEVSRVDYNLPDWSSDDSVNWGRLARDQLVLASTPAPAPGSWQLEFTEHLEQVAAVGLDAQDPVAGAWRWLITRDEDQKPSNVEITAWATVITRTFAGQMASNADLRGYLAELEKHDERAVQTALLWRLDGQRIALQIIAAAAAVAALAYGIDLGT